MSPIAAYYVMVATDHERQSRRAHYVVPAPRTSRVTRVVETLGTLVRLGRPSTAQPI